MRAGLIAILLALAGPAAGAGFPIPFTPLDPADYQSFVVNWTPAEEPLCAMIDSAAHWGAVLHPAPVMGGRAVFGPPPSLWRAGGVVLLVARVVPQGDASGVFQPQAVTQARGAVTVRYGFKPTPPASSSMKSYMALQFAGPTPTVVNFVENGRVVCELRAGAGQWASPAVGKP